MTRLVFIDTETTSLRPDRRAWDIALIVRDPGTVPGQEDTWQWFIEREGLDLGNADPFALKVGHFHDRHPEFAKNSVEDVWEEPVILAEVEQLTRGAHLVGNVPNFDAEVLAARMRAHGFTPAWHYHLIDVEALAVGWLNAMARWAPEVLSGVHGLTPGQITTLPSHRPWDSEALSSMLGVKPAEGDERHTALGDAEWAMRLYDAIVLRP